MAEVTRSELPGCARFELLSWIDCRPLCGLLGQTHDEYYDVLPRVRATGKHVVVAKLAAATNHLRAESEKLLAETEDLLLSASGIPADDLVRTESPKSKRPAFS